jgi:hypothetical protein
LSRQLANLLMMLLTALVREIAAFILLFSLSVGPGRPVDNGSVTAFCWRCDQFVMVLRRPPRPLFSVLRPGFRVTRRPMGEERRYIRLSVSVSPTPAKVAIMAS